MHVDLLSQLVADRKAELAADAQRQRRARRAMPSADETMTRREWRALLRILQLAR
jgi:hypothetical protein